MTTAIFGGSFNPPHVGHVLAVSYVLSVHAVSEVIVIPVFQHAFGKELASFDDRVAMAERAMGWLPGVQVSEIERELGGESKTLHTIEALLERDPGLKLRLVIGADVLSDLSKWHRWDRIAELAPPLVIGRAGVAHEDAPEAVLPMVSSTQIRELVGAGRMAEVRHLVPAGVREHIRQHGLYR